VVPAGIPRHFEGNPLQYDYVAQGWGLLQGLIGNRFEWDDFASAPKGIRHEQSFGLSVRQA
jgi:hypothetical protein